MPTPDSPRSLGAPRPELRTPRAAAIAGLAFALLHGTSLVLLRISVQDLPSEEGAARLAAQSAMPSLALALFPFGGIAFLWFIGVVRDRLGAKEDRFLATVFLGSGILFLGLTFVAASLSGGLLAACIARPTQLFESGLYDLLRDVIYRLNNVYGVRMSGVFMMSLATLWVRTGAMPRWLAFLTYGSAVAMLFVMRSTLWLALVFPTWVGIIGAYILVTNLREPRDLGPT